MKANKALKRLAKIDALMSDVIERYSTHASPIRKALRDVMDAVALSKKLVSQEASSRRPTNPPVKQTTWKKAAPKSAPARKAVPKPGAVKRVVPKKAALANARTTTPAKMSAVRKIASV